MSCPTAIRILRLAWNRLTFALGPTFAMGAPPPIHFLPARDLGDRAGLKFWDTWLLPSFRALRVLETRSFKYYKVPSLAQLKYCKMCTFYNQMCLSWIWVAVWVPSVEPDVMRKTYVFSYTSVRECRLSCGLSSLGNNSNACKTYMFSHTSFTYLAAGTCGKRSQLPAQNAQSIVITKSPALG